MNRPMTAIIKKDIRGVTANKRMFTTLLVVPLVLVVFLPTVFILSLHFMPDENGELLKLLKLLPLNVQAGSTPSALTHLLFNYILPVFFLIIPIMASSVMAASSFVGEKEKHTLETLLYCPLSLQQIFRAKVLASFFLSMGVSLLSFLCMLVVVEGESFLITHSLVLPKINWLLILLLVSPALSLIAITLTVRVSAKAQSVEDAQQGAVFLLMPVLLMIIGQFTGVLLVSGWLLLAIGLVCAVLAALLLKNAINHFKYETLLKQ